MRGILITGGAGFIGRWVVRRFLDAGCEVTVLDNLSSGSEENLAEFRGKIDFVKGNVQDKSVVSKIFDGGIDACIHLAAQINVHESLQNPGKSFESNVLGTYTLLESARKHKTPISVIGTCMVYDLAGATAAISESHPTKPKSPYAATKLAAEEIALSYHQAYGLPVRILRPFNTYGPFQRSDAEGGVISVFIKRALEKKPLQIFGDGTQTRDFLYAEDCAEFIFKASTSDKAIGRVLNAGTGKDVSINKLAELVSRDRVPIEHIPHHHPQAEIQKLECDPSLAKRLLGWQPKTELKQGLAKTEEWISANEAK